MKSGACHIQHLFQMDFWSQEQSSQLPFQISNTYKHISQHASFFPWWASFPYQKSYPKHPCYHLNSTSRYSTSDFSGTHYCPKTTQQIAWKPYCKCRRPTHSLSTFPGDYWMARHLTMNLTPLLMSKDSYTNISKTLVKSFMLWSFLNLGNIQYSWKLMTNWVTKVIHVHIVSSNVNTIGKGWTRALGNILLTEFFANGKKLKFNNTHYRWLKYLVDHLIR